MLVSRQAAPSHILLTNREPNTKHQDHAEFDQSKGMSPWAANGHRDVDPGLHPGGFLFTLSCPARHLCTGGPSSRDAPGPSAPSVLLDFDIFRGGGASAWAGVPKLPYPSSVAPCITSRLGGASLVVDRGSPARAKAVASAGLAFPHVRVTGLARAPPPHCVLLELGRLCGRAVSEGKEQFEALTCVAA